jgi:hypothetical protein
MPHRIPGLARSVALVALAVAGPAKQAAGLEFQLLTPFTQAAGARPGSAEILSYTPHQHTLASTMAGSAGYGVQLLTLGADGSLTERAVVTFDDAFGGPALIGSASSTALDPLGRGFGAVALIPTSSGTTVGKVGFFDYQVTPAGASRNLLTVDVGFHPDSIRFSGDGRYLFVANEGEFTTGGGTDAAGSVSIVDLSSVAGLADLSTLTGAAVHTFDFSAGNLGPGVSLTGLRLNDTSAGALAEPHRHVEPEYVYELGGRVFVSLQENNAIAVLDVASANLADSRWSAIHPLGTLTQTIDASDRDGPGGGTAAKIDDVVAGLPMPDAIAAFEHDGQVYVVSVNEGDARPDDGDIARFGSNVDPDFAGDGTSAGLGRLNVLKAESDTDGDGKLDQPVMLGTRSFSIWSAADGSLVKDSGSLESVLLALDAATHNMNSGLPSNFDTRSDDKGPEPEALAVAMLGERRVAFVGMERQNGILAYDITDPTQMVRLGYVNSYADGLISPESLLFVDAADSPTGTALLLAGYELGDGAIGVYSVVPVPPAVWLLGTALGLLGVTRRRRVAS